MTSCVQLSFRGWPPADRAFAQLVAKATGFLGVVVKMPSQKHLFQEQQTLEAFCEKIILPNMTLRKFEEELFEDDALEYVRRDLESASASPAFVLPKIM